MLSCIKFTSSEVDPNEPGKSLMEEDFERRNNYSASSQKFSREEHQLCHEEPMSCRKEAEKIK